MWENVPKSAGTGDWAELDDNGWGALMGWSAGADNLRRTPVDDTARTVRVTTTGPTGVRKTEEVNRPGFSGGSQPMEDESYGDEVQR